MIPFFPEPPPAPPARRRLACVRGWRRRRRRPFKNSDPRSWNLTLAASGIGVPLRLAADSPALLSALVEDLEWRLALSDLHARRPRWWQWSALAEWNAEGDRLEQERRRIAEIAARAVSAL